MTNTRSQSHLPTAVDMLDSVLVLITGAVLAAPILPGFTLTVAGVILLAVVVLAPLIVAALLISLVAGIVAIPYLLVREAFTKREARSTRSSASRLGSALTTPLRATIRP